MPAHVARPGRLGAPGLSGVHGQGDRASEDGQGAGPHEPVGADREAERHQDGADGEPQHGEIGTRDTQDARPDDGGEEVQQRRGDDERDEADEVEPGVGRPQVAPGLHDRREPCQEERGQERARGHQQQRGRVAERHHATRASQRPAHRHDGGVGRQDDAGQEGAAAGRCQPEVGGHVSSCDRQGAQRHGRHRSPAHPCVHRLSGGEGGAEEGHHAGDGGRGASGQRQVQRQPGAQAQGGRQEGGHCGRTQEGQGGRDGCHGHQAVGAPVHGRAARAAVVKLDHRSPRDPPAPYSPE